MNSVADSARSQTIRVVLFGAIAVLAVLNVLPILWGGLTSIKPGGDILSYPPRVVGFWPTIEHYATVLGGSFVGSFRITAFYGVIATGVGLLLASMAAYALDRLSFPFRRWVFYGIAGSIPLSIGATTLIVPSYLYFAELRLIDQWFTLPLVYVGLNLPMAVWVMKGSMQTVPKDLDDAAQMDGASRMRVLFRIVLPLCRPGLFAAGLLIFIGSWNEFVAGSVMVSNESLQPVQVAVYQYISVFGRMWGPLTAAAVLAVLPILCALIFMGRHLVSGLSAGATKG